MPEGVDYDELKNQADDVYKAFEQKFERFARFEETGTSESGSQTASVEQLRALDELDKEFTGKKSAFAAIKKSVGRLPAERRAEFGQLVQGIEAAIVARVSNARQNLQVLIDEARIESERIDITLPGRRPRRGHVHPITLVRQRIEDIFVSLGYVVEDDREIETDFYNFEALNIPEGHPAKDPQDTFYTTDGFALRSQTSTVQIHAMERRGVPIRMIAPGRVFRRDTPDATHNPMFFQVEGLCVDRGITMAHLKGTVGEFLKRMYGSGTRTRFRPSFFPFTEPSAEFDFSCFKCGGTGCSMCKGSG